MAVIIIIMFMLYVLHLLRNRSQNKPKAHQRESGEVTKEKETFTFVSETIRSVVAQRELLALYIIYLNVDNCKHNLISNVNDIKLSIVASITLKCKLEYKPQHI